MTAPVPFWMNYCSSSYWTRSSHRGCWVTLLLLFWPALQEFFFFSPVDLSCSPNYLVQKSVPTYPAPLPMLRVFFSSKLSFFSAIIVTPIANWKNMTIVHHHHRWCSKKNKELLQLEDLSNINCNIFKKHENKICLLQKHSALQVSLDFQFGFRLMFIFALLVFKVHQHLESALMSFMFRHPELVAMIVAKSIVVGAYVAKMTLLAQMLWEQVLLKWPCWGASTFFF